jgi:arylsulfatase A-like enzyme
MPEQPHLLFFMADHLRYDCLSCYDDIGVRTPNLDRIAGESVVFDRAYCATPLCVPTRTCIATGRWPHASGAIVNGGSIPGEEEFSRIGPETPTLYESLDAAGYEILQVGIQHIHSQPALPERVPDAEFVGRAEYIAYSDALGLAFDEAAHARRPVPEFRNGRPAGVKQYYSPMHVSTLPYAKEHFLDIWWANELKNRILKRDFTRPQAIFLHLWAPHPPFFLPEPYASMYRPEMIDLPENVGIWYDAQPAYLLHGTGARGAQFLRDDWRRTWAAYFGLVTMVDDCMGMVADACRERGIWEDAFAIFTQDHGELLGAHALFQKFTMYEESARVPLLIKPPGHRSSEHRSQPVGHIDLAQTVCDYTGAASPPGAQGASLRPLLDDPQASWRESTFVEFHGDHGRGWPCRAVVNERYKYIHHFGPEAELYDLAEDPRETRSLIDKPEMRSVIAEMRDQLRAWMVETGDILDLERDTSFCPCRWQNFDREKGWTDY